MITPVTPLLEAQTIECSQFINPYSLRVLATQLRNFGISLLSSSPPFNHHGRSSQMCYLVSVVGGLLNEEAVKNNLTINLIELFKQCLKMDIRTIWIGIWEITLDWVGFPVWPAQRKA
ncbi:uncharacterized protein [Spinacia oleracea]|uniref:Uncharacterized protein isoform X2 n=1 Tax=Spinacia oleracea TaxID=3562 RepID=A0ABM3RMH2_SPIOL|nr:uncharacterized protein LOC110793975 isoform X2 [Spinacia oleracea]